VDFGVYPWFFDKPVAVSFWFVDRCFQNGLEMIAKDCKWFQYIYIYISYNYPRTKVSRTLSNHQPATNYIIRSFSAYLRLIQPWSESIGPWYWLVSRISQFMNCNDPQIYKRVAGTITPELIMNQHVFEHSSLCNCPTSIETGPPLPSKKPMFPPSRHHLR